MTSLEPEIRARYRNAVLEWAGAQADPARANRLFKKHHAYYKSIRDTAEGQAALVELLNDTDLAVRVMAATHVLPFDPERGIAVLEEAEHESGAFSLDAKYTLMSYRSGKLNLDW